MTLAVGVTACSSTLLEDKVSIKDCYDGDTCTTKAGEKIRLACIDAPELLGERSDPIAGKKAKEFLKELVVGETISIKRITKDRYGRTVAELSKDGVNLQEKLFKKGHAVIYKKYAHQCQWSKNIK